MHQSSSLLTSLFGGPLPVPCGCGLASHATRYAYVTLKPQFPNNSVRNWFWGGINGVGVAVLGVGAGKGIGAGVGAGKGGIVGGMAVAASGGTNTYSKRE